ncbi:MAG: hypothetical protein CVT64_04025 [Actinobacteria bacterium HGW-Actinobacteria-4]|nr:MAG: hypothetical protein CVT64_04025 [Actinobacteria bacterium HGW-Actinobacteria-4]
MNTAFAHLNTLNRLGAAQFAERRLATDHSAVTRTVRRHRAVRGGVTAVAALGLAGGATLAAQAFTANPIQPGTTSPSPTFDPSPSPAPSPTPYIAPSVGPSPAPSPSPGADFVPEFALGCEVPRIGFTTGVANGYVPEGELCLLKDLQSQLRADAAVSLAHLNEQFKTELGKDICVLEGYRDANKQAEVQRRRGVPAGASAHGYGLAIDLCETSQGQDPIAWLEDNAPAWGWIQPQSTAADEPWHWVYLPGAAEYPEDHGLSDREVNQVSD